ncbi:hypothetical protein OHA27_23750 [Streptomyces sp. NBC_01619]|uniref:hypothetical protein n=1 Tax=Streptomyces sp. NBC_01619 TaxID=2975901 RepID=UPI00225A6B45|nr:hypothetical protein [Streptomyces sp. NBC_01619]MCX4513276.1 hypothetical protein [Streptomyces sp. NBC_01619]
MAWILAGVVPLAALLLWWLLPVNGDSEQQAAASVARVSATAKDWGAGFIEDDDPPSDAGEVRVREDCSHYLKADRPGTLAVLVRFVARKEPAREAFSEVRLYDNVATAEKYMDDWEEAVHRCPTQTDGKERFEDIREAYSPQLSGFDEVLLEEGRRIAGDDGEKLDEVFVGMVGRRGEFIVQASVFGPAGHATELRTLVVGAMQRMQRRVAEQAHP